MNIKKIQPILLTRVSQTANEMPTEQRASRICFGVPSPSYQSSSSIDYNCSLNFWPPAGSDILPLDEYIRLVINRIFDNLAFYYRMIAEQMKRRRLWVV